MKDAEEILEMIEELRAPEGASILICCKNPDFNGQKNERVVCQAPFTNWKEVAFVGDTLVEALRRAAAAQSRTPLKTHRNHPLR